MKWSNRALTVAAMLFSAISGPLAAAEWQSVPDESELRFVARYDGQPLDGRFRSFTVTVAPDEAGAGPGQLQVEVDVASADMNDREINDEISRPDWFYVERFPVATFRSLRIERDDQGDYLASGTLELKGIERETSVPFTWQIGEDRAVLAGSMTLSRLAWQIGMGEWKSDEPIADTVELEFRVVLRGAD